MTTLDTEKAYLVLENGQVFAGRRCGAAGDVVGELVFTTGMCGYIETLTDPSYLGQIVMQTFPLIGNYGMIPADAEGRPLLKGYVAREICRRPSNFRAEGDLDTYLRQQGIPGVCGIDTRQVTRIIREAGVMNAMICGQPPSDLSMIKDYSVRETVRQASGDGGFYPAEGSARCRVTLIDYGLKANLLRELRARGCDLTVLPWDSSAAAVLATEPDGVLLSNGPGDPADNPLCISVVRELVGKKPLMGVCLGHQLLALAGGGATVKLKYGHRGANQPVRDLQGGRTYITSQNHGYAVDGEHLPPAARLSFVNQNDHSCEGLDYPGLRAFSVQFHPEACAGPHDTGFLFDRFLAMMGVDAGRID